MSFSKSNITSGNFLTNLTKTNGIASTYDAETSTGKLYYSLDGGTIWCPAKSLPDTSFVTALSLTGANRILNAVAAGINNTTFYPVVYYSINSGQSWNLSESGLPDISSTVVYKMFANISGLNGVIAVETGSSEVLIYYSIDGGNNWSQSFLYNPLLEEYLPFYFPNNTINNSAITLYKNVDISNVIYIITLTDIDSNDFNIFTSIDGGKILKLVYL